MTVGTSKLTLENQITPTLFIVHYKSPRTCSLSFAIQTC